jgi:hypothetical protein
MKKDTRNRVTRPGEGTVNRRVWDISDLHYAAGEKKLRKAVLAQCAAEGLSLRTASTEHNMWRRFMGLVRNLKKGVPHGNQSIGSI